MKTERVVALSLATVVSLLGAFPTTTAAADAARVAGELKANGIHFNDSSTLYSSNGLLKDKGVWISSTLYSAGDIVQSNGSSYVCTTANTNITPPNASYWSVLAAQGAQGIQGLQGPPGTCSLPNCPEGSILISTGSSQWACKSFYYGYCTPLIDGVIGTDWSHEAWDIFGDSVHPWGDNNRLNSLKICYDNGALYFGLNGRSDSNNFIALLLDINYGSALGVNTGVSLADPVGNLDAALSGKSWVGNSNFLADFAWGTIGMASVSSGSTSDNVGLRNISVSLTNFGWDNASTTVCNFNNSNCEVKIPWSSLFQGGKPTNAVMGLAVRLMSKTGNYFAPDTLPTSSTPESIENVFVFKIP